MNTFHHYHGFLTCSIDSDQSSIQSTGGRVWNIDCYSFVSNVSTAGTILTKILTIVLKTLQSQNGCTCNERPRAFLISTNSECMGSPPSLFIYHVHRVLFCAWSSLCPVVSTTDWGKNREWEFPRCVSVPIAHLTYDHLLLRI